MSKQVTIKGFVYEADYYGAQKEYSIYHCDTMSDKWNTLIGPAEFSYTIPEDFNPTAQKLAALEAAKVKAREEYQATVAELNERISKLQALTFDEVTA
jgi:hypothetical protein